MKVWIAVAAALFAVPAVARDTYVKPYINKNGEYVEGHYRSAPNSTKLDNYSTDGNYNPYTGKKGTVDPFDLDGGTRKRSSTYEYKPYTYESPYTSGYSSKSKKRGY